MNKKMSIAATTQQIIEKIEKKSGKTIVRMAAVEDDFIIVPECGFKGVKVEEGDCFDLTIVDPTYAYIELQGWKIAVKYIEKVCPPATTPITIKTISEKEGRYTITTEEQGDDKLITPEVYEDVLVNVRPGDKFDLIGLGGDFYIENKTESIPVEYIDMSTTS